MDFMFFLNYGIDVCGVRLEQMHVFVILRKYVHFVTGVDSFII
jgi:hypothetical protein